MELYMIELRIPKLHELRLSHLLAIQDIDKNGLNAYDKVRVLSKLTGIDIEELKHYSLNDIDKALNAYFKLFATIDKDSVNKEIDVNGKRYELVKSFSKMPIKWHIDMSSFDIKDMAILAAFCYIEKGMEYCEMDKHRNIKNPLMLRAETFREFMEVEHFVKIGFFLQKKAVNYTKAFTEIKNQREKREGKQARTSGKQLFRWWQKN